MEETKNTVEGTESVKPKLKTLQVDPDAIRRMEDVVAIISAMGWVLQEQEEGQLKTIYHLCNDITEVENESESETENK